MKLCAICATDNDADVITCKTCGEGSFTAPHMSAPAVVAPAASPEPEPEAEVVPTHEVFRGTGPSKRRGR